jgi:aryl-alcohol dehydrogenase-like predicted oxidoreductase
LWTRDVESNGVLETCRELNIGFVPFSPLGRGFLTGEIKQINDLDADDYRRISPRFMDENFAKNFELVEKIKEIADAKSCTSAQIALAWVMANGENIVPIPGTKRLKYLEQNAEATEISFTSDELASLANIGKPAGERYPPIYLSNVNK